MMNSIITSNDNDTTRPKSRLASGRSALLIRNKTAAAVAALFWLAVWQIVSMSVAQELLVPAPLAVLNTLGSLVVTAEFWQTAGLSLLRIIAGFVAGVLLGTLAAMLTTRYRAADLLLSPVMRVIRATPVASFIILALVWIRIGMLPVFISFLMVVPLVWGNVEKGIRNIDTRLLEMAQVYRLSRVKTFVHVKVPSVMPFFMAACNTGVGLAWKAGIAAEVICLPPISIGKQLYNAKIYLETPEVFAFTFTVIGLSLLLEKLIVAVAKRFGGRFNATGGE